MISAENYCTGVAAEKKMKKKKKTYRKDQSPSSPAQSSYTTTPASQLAPLQRRREIIRKVHQPVQHPVLRIEKVVARVVPHAPHHARRVGHRRREPRGSRREAPVCAENPVVAAVAVVLHVVRLHEGAVEVGGRGGGLVGRVGVCGVLEGYGCC